MAERVGRGFANYRVYMLGLLLLVMALNTLDRIAVGLLLQDIKIDLQLSDTQLGVLTGIAFAFFYSVMGIPIARWADRGNRVTIIAVTTILWSAMMALCGVVSNFAQLVLVRVGLAVGEAGCVPPAHSLIPDYFSRAERPRAVGIYMLGGSLGTIIGFFAIGWLNEFYGWRWTFMIIGAPGFALAALAFFTLREPRRQIAADRRPVDGPLLKEVGSALWANRTFRHLALCLSVVAFFGNGILTWQPAFLIRSYGLSTGELGTWFAGIYGILGAISIYVGGALATKLAAENERLQLSAVAAVYILFGILQAAIYLSSNFYVTMALIGLASLGSGAINGPLFATVQTLVPESMRATAIAVIYLLANLIGLGFGPLAAGFLSDVLRPLFGEESLRYALLALCPGYALAAWYMWRASRSVTADLATLPMPSQS